MKWLPEKASIPFEKDRFAFRCTESLVNVAELKDNAEFTEIWLLVTVVPPRV